MITRNDSRYARILTITLLAALASAAIQATADASATRLGADHPNHPVDNDGWPAGYAELINAKQRVHGFWVNSEDVFFLKGDAAQLNAFLKKCSTFEDVDVTAVIHPGNVAVQSPWDDAPRELEADWRSYTAPFKLIGEGAQRRIGEHRFQVVVDIYLGGRVKLDDVAIPDGVVVKSGGEIETFIETHNAASK